MPVCFSGKSQVVERVFSEGPDKVSAMTTTSPQGRTELLRPDGSPVRVLVVDDELSITELLSMALRYEGWQIRSAGDGQGAVQTAREFRPDAVVLDMMLPDMDGLAVLGRLRRELPDVPVLFLTPAHSGILPVGPSLCPRVLQSPYRGGRGRELEGNHW